MIQPDSLEFFYAAEETSERAYKLERLLNRIYRVLVWLFASSVFVFVTMHAKQHYELKTFASDVSKKINKQGGKAVVGDDGSLTIYMDGKVQEVIPKEDRRIANKDIDGIQKNQLVK